MGFDYVTAYAGFLLWILFGYATPLLNCDLQTFLSTNIYGKHVCALITFFFLISAFIAPAERPLVVFYQTCLLYLFFMFMTKSTMIFSAIILFFILVDQSILLDINYQISKNAEADVTMLRRVRGALMIGIVSTALIGFFFYYFKKRRDYGEDFQFLSFFFGRNGPVVCHGIQRAQEAFDAAETAHAAAKAAKKAAKQAMSMMSAATDAPTSYASIHKGHISHGMNPRHFMHPRPAKLLPEFEQLRDGRSTFLEPTDPAMVKILAGDS